MATLERYFNHILPMYYPYGPMNGSFCKFPRDRGLAGAGVLGQFGPGLRIPFLGHFLKDAMIHSCQLQYINIVSRHTHNIYIYIYIYLVVSCIYNF